MKLNKRYSLWQFAFFQIFISYFLVTILTLSVVSYFGIYHSIVEKRKNAKEFANLITLSAGMPHGIGIGLSSIQANIFKEDPSISNINFYSFNEHVEVTKDIEDPPFLVVFTQNTYDIRGNVIYESEFDPDTISRFPLLSQLAPLDNNAIGYLVVQLDITEIRNQWFRNNIDLYVALVLIYILFLLFNLQFTKKYRTEVNDLQRMAKRLSEKNEQGTLSLPAVSQTISVNEYFNIQQSFIKIVASFNKIKVQNQELKSTVKSHQKSTVYAQSKNLQLQSMVSNELHRSLDIIVEGSKLLSKQYLLDEQKDALTLVRKGSQQMEFMLDQIKHLQQIESGHILVNRIEFSPLQLLSDIVVEYQVPINTKGIRLRNKISNIEYRLEGDIEKIRKIIKVMLQNAIDYTNEGSITIESYLQHFNHSTRWTIKITDTGIGIADEHLDKVFEPFFQVKRKSEVINQGIGVGLATAKQLAEIMNAKLSVTSDLNKGSTFQLILPLFNKDQLLERQYLRGINITCFQVGDNKEIVSTLYKFGANSVKLIHNINETIKYLSNKPSDVLLILPDVNRRKAMQLVSSLRASESNYRTLTVWLTTDNSICKEKEARANGVDVICDSTLDKREMVEIIRRWLN